MNDQLLELFKKLTEAPGAPGFEHQVRTIMREELSKYTDEIIQDNLGSIFGVKRGDENGHR
ncbi:MAG: M42 family metallopeptidase, partial [Cyanothece sp. SIO1E1]|nr:M42 family metallopeptidase [Cyanothece sp. SIO1E1]